MNKALQISETKLPSIDAVKSELVDIHNFQSLIKKELKENHDYGIIPGTVKPTLYKPGAEKITKIMHCRPRYKELGIIEDWDKPFFYYKFKCELILIPSDIILEEGYGSCNSMENRYRWRWVYLNELPSNIDKDDLTSKQFTSKKGNKYLKYRLENDDICTIVNTILKVGKKRSLVDAALSLGRLSSIFTQDMEDIIDVVVEEKPERPSPEEEVEPNDFVDGELEKVETEIEVNQRKAYKFWDDIPTVDNPKLYKPYLKASMARFHLFFKKELSLDHEGAKTWLKENLNITEGTEIILMNPAFRRDLNIGVYEITKKVMFE